MRQTPVALLDSSKPVLILNPPPQQQLFIYVKVLQNCKVNGLYSVFPRKLEVLILITLMNWFKSYVLFDYHNMDYSNNNNRYM